MLQSDQLFHVQNLFAQGALAAVELVSKKLGRS